MGYLGYNNYIQPDSAQDTEINILSSNQTLQAYYLELANRVIEVLDTTSASSLEPLTNKLGDINTPDTVIGLLKLVLDNPNLATKEKQNELIQAISNISFESNVSFDSTGLATAEHQNSIISKVGDINTENTLIFLLNQIVNTQNSLIEYINNLNPITRSITHKLLKDINNDGFDDTDPSLPASTTIVGGKRYISWFIRGGNPVVDGVIWHPQEEKNISAGYGEVLDSVFIDYTGAEVLVSYY